MDMNAVAATITVLHQAGQLIIQFSRPLRDLLTKQKIRPRQQAASLHRGILQKMAAGQTFLVASNLFAGTDVLIPSVRVEESHIVKFREWPDLDLSGQEVEGTMVNEPGPIMGLYDAFALAELYAALLHSQINTQLALDDLSARERSENNLVLLGSPSSNLVAREVYSEGAHSWLQFDDTYSSFTLSQDTHFCGGHHGLIAWLRNPWNADRRVLWMAGLGTVGTGAAVRFVLDSFEDAVPDEVKNSDQFVIAVRGEIDSAGYLTASSLLQRITEPHTTRDSRRQSLPSSLADRDPPSS